MELVHETQVFRRSQNAITVGLQGSTIEKGLLTSGEALLATCDLAKPNGASWLRQDSALAVVLVTDEYNCGYSYNAPQTPPGSCAPTDISWGGKAHANPNGYLALLNTLRPGSGGIGTKAKVYGFINNPASTPQLSSAGYMDVITATGGAWMHLVSNATDQNSPEYLAAENKFKDFSKELAKAIRRQVEFNQILPEVPMDGSMQVFIDNQELSSDQFDFDPETRTIEISTDLDASSSAVIKIGYKVQLGEVIHKFTLQRKPDGDNISLKIRKKDSEEWLTMTSDSFTRNGKEIDFIKPIDVGAEVNIKYKYKN